MPDSPPPNPGPGPDVAAEARAELSEGLRRARRLASATRRLFQFQTTPDHRPPPDLLKE